MLSLVLVVTGISLKNEFDSPHLCFKVIQTVCILFNAQCFNFGSNLINRSNLYPTGFEKVFLYNRNIYSVPKDDDNFVFCVMTLQS